MLNVCDVGLMEVLLIGDLVFFSSLKVKGVGGGLTARVFCVRF